MRDHRIQRKALAYLIALIRDDIHVRMQQVIVSASDRAKRLQRGHIAVFLRCINRWERARKRQYRLEANWAAHYATENTLEACLYRGREKIESQLAASEQLAASLVQRIQPLAFTFFHHDSEYLGNQELDPGYAKGKSNHGLIHPWLARRPTDYWFDHTGVGYSPVTVVEDDDEILVMPSVLMQSVRLGIPGFEDGETGSDSGEQRALSPPQVGNGVVE
jgi:hypothetical protein